MFTTETALDALKKFDIDETTLAQWEQELGLVVPVDEYGRKQYSPHHINLFKNIKKHIALGRSIGQIKAIISLPPSQDARQAAKQPTKQGFAPRQQRSGIRVNPYATQPKRPQSTIPMPQPLPQPQLSQPQIQPQPQLAPPPEIAEPIPAPMPIPPVVMPQAKVPVISEAQATENAKLLDLLNKQVQEKDTLHQKLTETEKLNSHLYNANTMYSRKVKEMSQQIATLKRFVSDVQDRLKEDKSLKLLDEKAQLQKQLLDSEKLMQLREQELEHQKQLLQEKQGHAAKLENHWLDLTERFNPRRFCGDWYEQAALLDIAYDNFGINIETDRQRMFRIAEIPEQSFGPTALIQTQYEYESNALWKRQETLFLAYFNDSRLEGTMVVEFILDGVPVAKANYRVTLSKENPAQPSSERGFDFQF